MNGATTGFENRFFADGRLVGCRSLPFSLYRKSNENRRERQRCIGDYKIKAFQNIVSFKAVLTNSVPFLNYSPSANQSRLQSDSLHVLLVLHTWRRLIDEPIIVLISKWEIGTARDT